MFPTFEQTGCFPVLPHQSLYNLLLSFYQSYVTQPVKILKKLHLYQPLTNCHNSNYLQTKQINCFSELDIAAAKDIKINKFNRILRKTKYARKFVVDLGSFNGVESIYKNVAKKIRTLIINRLGSMNPNQRRVFSYKVREFKQIKRIHCENIPDLSSIPKERQWIRSSISSLRKLEVLKLSCLKSTSLLSSVAAFMLAPLKKLKVLQLSFHNLSSPQFFMIQKSLLKLTNLRNLNFSIPENQFDDSLVKLFKLWLQQASRLTQGQITILDSTFAVDLSPLNEFSFLEFKFILTRGIKDIASNLMNLEKIKLPVSFDWKILPTETLDHASTELILYFMGRMQKISAVSQSYSFEIENSDLTGCYPVWAFILTNNNFQMIRELTLSVLLNPDMSQQFFMIFAFSIPNMVNLSELSFTLHNDGSSNKKFYLEESIIDSFKAIGKLPLLTKFEFNSEIEIYINTLNEFYNELTSFQNLCSFKSEWLQVSVKSLKTFFKKLYHLENLEFLDIHLYSLSHIRVEEIKDAFDDLKSSISKMARLKKLQISADNECFGNENLWQDTEIVLRKEFTSKLIELNLAHTE